MEQFQGPGACLVVEPIIREGFDDASQEKGNSCFFVLERYRERSTAHHSKLLFEITPPLKKVYNGLNSDLFMNLIIKQNYATLAYDTSCNS